MHFHYILKGKRNAQEHDMGKFSDYVTENYENWTVVYFGYFALKSLVKTTQP